LTNITEVLFSNAATIPNFAEYLQASKYHVAVSGILKQGVERLDNVRQIAGEHISRLLVLPLPTVADAGQWHIEGQELMKDLFLTYVILSLSILDVEQVLEPATVSPMDGRTARGCFPGPSNFCGWKSIAYRFLWA
jgi:hypothetical protein